MITKQPTIFDRKKYTGVLSQGYQIEPPATDQTVLKTLPAYYAYLQSGEYSKYTPADFTSDIKKFGLFVKDRPLHAVQTVDIQQWIGELKKTMTAKTVSRKVSALNNYFIWLEHEKVLAVNPAHSIRVARVTSPLPDILFDSECRQLRAAASRDPRAYLVLLLLLETGMKKAELFDLKLTHFDFSDAYAPELWVKHTGKQVRKDRKLKLPPEIVPVFADYVERYNITDTLFPYTPRFIEVVLATTAKQARLQKKVTAGILRDTFVVRSFKQGAKLEDVLQKIGLSTGYHKYFPSLTGRTRKERLRVGGEEYAWSQSQLSH
jgi:site-specific recombinase XerD